MSDWKEKFRRFMVGRYGTDELNRFLSSVALVLIVLDIFLRIRFLYGLALLLLVVVYARSFSKIRRSVLRKIRSMSIIGFMQRNL